MSGCEKAENLEKQGRESEQLLPSALAQPSPCRERESYCLRVDLSEEKAEGEAEGAEAFLLEEAEERLARSKGSGRKILLTGASGDLGSAMSQRLAKEGYSLALQGHQQMDKLQELVSDLRRRYPLQRFQAFSADLSLEGEALSLHREVLQYFGEIDILVYNAGRQLWGLFQDFDLKSYESLHRLMLQSLLELTKVCAPAMLRQAWGRVVTISSIWGQTGASCEVLYSALKAAQIGFSKALAKEWAPMGITVNSIAPGAVEGKMTSAFSAEALAELKEEIPMGRLARPEEIANCLSFLLSEEAAYLTGQLLSPNGGWYC